MSRRIRDFRLGTRGRLEGHATIAPGIAPDRDGLVHEETGRLNFGFYQGDVSRRYLIALDGPETASLHHADGTLFHALDLSSGIADILHRCGDDQYCGRYRVLHRDCLLVRWHVTGPRKHYRLSTRYVRAR
jgi:hypothetical protein